MFKEVKIGDKTVGMLANGATPIRYRMIFGKDLIGEFQGADEKDTGRVSDSLAELAYIMAMASDAKDGKVSMDKLNQDSFVKWLEQFEPLDIAMAAEYIIDVYMGNQEIHSESKKKVEAVKEK